MIYYLANLYINAIVSFFVGLLFVELFILIFRLKRQKKFRLISSLRLIPFIKVLYDIFFNYDLHRWAIANGVDIINRLPFSIHTYFGAMFYKPFIPAYSYLDFSIYHIFTFSLADLITQNIGFNATLFLVAVFITGSAVCFSKFVMDVLGSFHSLNKNLSQHQELNEFPEIIRERLSKTGAKIYLSDEAGVSPFSYGFIHPKIVISKTLFYSLSQRELIALIEHEISHIRWFDLISQLFIRLTGSLFWQIPLIQSYAKRFSFSNELACDEAAQNKMDLAELIRKTMGSILMPAPVYASALMASRSLVVRRINNLLDFKQKKSGTIFLLLNILLVLFAGVIILMVLKSRFGII
jgi:beta-lactamase regulating signal transducer with metallopeptidase domain